MSTTSTTPRADAAINTNVRLFDLVRFMRSELHAAELITDDEYSWLCHGAEMANSKAGGSPSPRRLEDYDGIRKQLAAEIAARNGWWDNCKKAEAELAEAKAELAHWQQVAEQMSAEREHNANVADALRADLSAYRSAYNDEHSRRLKLQAALEETP